MLPIEYFHRFRREVLALPIRPDGYSREELINDRFHLFSDCGLDVYYAPFHHLNPNVSVILVGLTPGWTQMEAAFRAARLGMAAGLEGQALFRHIDLSGSFSGPLRRNLVSMLNGIGLHSLMGMRSCDQLFDVEGGQCLAGFTSLVSAPIFKEEINYRGYGPRLLSAPKLREWVLQTLAPELASAPDSIVVPLGTIADGVMDFLCEQRPRLLDRTRLLRGFPHPSGANGHRKLAFEQGREEWKRQMAKRLKKRH